MARIRRNLPVQSRLVPRRRSCAVRTLMQNLKSQSCAVRFLQDRGLLHRTRRCPKGHLMSLHTNQVRSPRWRCRSCNFEISALKGTFFTNMRVPLHKIITLIYFYSNDISLARASEFAGVNAGHTGSRIVRKVLNCCAQINTQFAPEAGTVELDESLIGNEIVLGGTFLETGHVFAKVIARRNQDCIFPVLKRYISDYATVVTDRYRAYKNLSKYNPRWTHHVVVHRRHYVDPVTRATTNHVESFWSALKRVYRGQNLDDFLTVETFKRNTRPNDQFNAVLEAISEVYSLN